jgi:hypothetical protein
MPKASEEKRSYWRGMLRRQRESGLSVRQFCADEDLSYASFYRWKRKIGPGDRRAVDKSRRQVSQHPPTLSRVAKPSGSTGAFIPVRVRAAGSSVLEVVHPRGHVVRVPAAFDAGSLQQVLDVLDRQGGV